MPPRAKRQRPPTTNPPTACRSHLDDLVESALRVFVQHPACINSSMRLVCREFRRLHLQTRVGVRQDNWDPTLFRHFLDHHHQQITELYISDCHLEPKILTLICLLPQLRKLSLRHCNLDMQGMEKLPWVLVACNSWSHLIELDLSGCDGAGELLIQMTACFMLVASLRALPWHKLPGAGTGCRQRTRGRLSPSAYKPFMADGFRSLLGFSSVRSPGVGFAGRECRDPGDALARLASRMSPADMQSMLDGHSGFSNLQRLRLSGCMDVNDKTVWQLVWLTSLRTLDLSGCTQIGFTGFTMVAHMFWLHCLYLSNCCNVNSYVLNVLTVGYSPSLWDQVGPHLQRWHKQHAIPPTTLEPPSGLTNLQQLSLSSCIQVGPSMLAKVSRLTALTHLDLSACSHVGNAALQHVGGVSSLQKLVLNSCPLVDAAALQPLSSCIALTHLDLGFCTSMTSAGLGHLAPCTKLAHLNLQGCESLTVPALRHLAGCSGLRHLNLAGCSAWSPVCSVGMLFDHWGGCATGLTHLELPSSCELDAAGELLLARCQNLEHLTLWVEDVSGYAGLARLLEGCVDENDDEIAPEETYSQSAGVEPVLADASDTSADHNTYVALAEDTEVVAVKPYENSQGATHSPGLNKLKYLGLRMGWGKLNAGVALRHMTRLTSLSELDLLGWGCHSRMGVEAFKHIAMLANLHSLALQSCKLVCGQGLQHITTLSALTRLELACCQRVDSSATKALVHLTSLRHLSLSGCPEVAYCGKVELWRLGRLQHLDLSSCFVRQRAHTRTRSFLWYVTGLTRLSQLVLQHCSGLDSADLERLSVLSVLQHLDLRHDWPATSMAARLSSLSCLTALRYLDVGHTGLNVARVSTLMSLRHLGLHGCLSDGEEFMQHLSGLCSLRVLDLRGNPIRPSMLTGVSKLPALNQLDLRHCTVMAEEAMAVVESLREVMSRCQVLWPGTEAG